MTAIELTGEQSQTVSAQQGKPIDVVDPATKRRYVLIAGEQYERVRALLELGTTQPNVTDGAGILPGVLRSQQTFWRDLPELLAQRNLRGQWVCYHGDERVGIGSYEDLIRECLRRGLPDDAYCLARIRPRERPPWETKVVEAIVSHHTED
jgi:hypothetical protein